MRKVKIGSRTVPYWAAGNAYLPYSQGYFANAAMLTWAFQPSIVVSDFGSVGGFDGGGFGGFDGGGAGGDGGGF